MKKIKILSFLVFSIFLVSCNDEKLNKLKQENEDLKARIETLQQENEKLKEKEIKRIISSIPKKIKNAKSISDAENILENIMEKYGSYPEIEQIINKEKEKLKEEKEKKNKIKHKKQKIKNLSKETEALKMAEVILKAFNNKLNNRTALANFLFNLLGEPTQITFFSNVPTFGNTYFFDEYFLIYGNKFNLTNMTLPVLYKRLSSVPFCVVYDDFDNNVTTLFKGEPINDEVSIFYFGRKYNYENKVFEDYRVGDYMPI